jgi:Protein of unknown function (DUF4256)
MAKTKSANKSSAAPQRDELLQLLKARFEGNMGRHRGIQWAIVEARLKANSGKLRSVGEMERTGGEPDVVGFDKGADAYLIYDCCAESPIGRRSVCYDPAALASRKENKPKHSALGMAVEMGVQLLTEGQYRKLQELGPFDQKTSSWIEAPADVRKAGGAIFGDFRYGRVFIYHNGAESYYAARGFRAGLKV